MATKKPSKGPMSPKLPGKGYGTKKERAPALPKVVASRKSPQLPGKSRRGK